MVKTLTTAKKYWYFEIFDDNFQNMENILECCSTLHDNDKESRRIHNSRVNWNSHHYHGFSTNGKALQIFFTNVLRPKVKTNFCCDNIH